MPKADMIDRLLDSAEAMHATGKPMMARLLPDEGASAEIYAHYPPDDVVNGSLGARWFYHCHPPGEREGDEHGHFHLFVAREALTGRALIAAPPTDAPRADVVHLAALAIDRQGLPLRWFTVNRWVTDEHLYPAASIADVLAAVDFRGPSGDPLINAWLSAILQLSVDDIVDLLEKRDLDLRKNGLDGEDRRREVLSASPVDLAALLD